MDLVPNLYLLTRCDMKCSFCYASKDIPDLTLGNAIKIIDTLKDIGVERINITGGEALLHKNVKDVIRYCFDAGFKVTLFTSGSMLNNDFIKEMKDFIDWWALSLDGTKDINISMGRSRRHYDSTINALISLRLNDCKSRLTSVVNKKNLLNLFPLSQELIEKGAIPSFWRIKQMVPTRGAKDIFETDSVSIDKFEKEMNCIIDNVNNRFKVSPVNMNDKSGDTMCIHPDGRATITISKSDDEMVITELGNMLLNPKLVQSSWNLYRDSQNSKNYTAMWS